MGQPHDDDDDDDDGGDADSDDIYGKGPKWLRLSELVQNLARQWHMIMTQLAWFGNRGFS